MMQYIFRNISSTDYKNIVGHFSLDLEYENELVALFKAGNSITIDAMVINDNLYAISFRVTPELHDNKIITIHETPFERIASFISIQWNIPQERIDISTDLFSTIGFDNEDMYVFIDFVYKAFHVKLPNKIPFRLTTIGQIISAIESGGQ